MPLTSKGKVIERAMEREYGDKKGKQVFYASKNKGTIKGVEGKNPVHKALFRAGSKEDLENYMKTHKNDKFKIKKKNDIRIFKKTI